MTAAITVTELFRVFQTPDGDAPALQGVDLTVDTGEVLAIIGPSGSGKSTLLRILAGLERPDAGTAIVMGERPAMMGPRELTAFRRARLGIVEQHAEHSISPEATCSDAVALQLQLLGHARSEGIRVARELLAGVGMAELAGRRIESLSGGQRQRVAVVAAMAHRPDLLLADEPTGELDEASATAVFETIRTLVDEAGTTAVLVSHDARIAAIADRAVAISDGRFATEFAGSGETAALVVGPGGWVQLPPELRVAGRVGTRVQAEATEHGIAFTPIDSPSLPVGGADRTDRPEPADAGSVASLDTVTKAFGGGAPLFDPVSASLDAGTLTAVTGGSGSGKTTLLRILSGQAQPTMGTCSVGGVDLSTLDDDGLAELRRQMIAVVDQDVGLVPFLTARENVAFGLSLRGQPESEAETWLLRLDLALRIDQRVERLSAGERQRVALARALAVSPKLLLVDEPTSRLDRRNAEQVARLLAEVTTERNICTVCSTHDVALQALADRQIRL